ncbi:MAG: hypothetical protein FJ390_06615 [Verrucomicrobia bacterium]|nr:hypothetical protein [Verrucomicrobiota bacterium]
MKKFFLFFFVVTLAASLFPVSAITPESNPSEIPGEIWQVITKANDQQIITVHLHEKLALKIHQVKQWAQNQDFCFNIANPSLLKLTLEGSLSNSSTGVHDCYVWVFQPHALGQTKLTLTQNHLFSSEQYATFIIDVVE